MIPQVEFFLFSFWKNSGYQKYFLKSTDLKSFQKKMVFRKIQFNKQLKSIEWNLINNIRNRIWIENLYDYIAHRHTTEMNYVTSQIICLFFNIFVSLCCHFICSFSCFSFYGSRKLCETFFNFSPADGFSAN